MKIMRATKKKHLRRDKQSLWWSFEAVIRFTHGGTLKVNVTAFRIMSFITQTNMVAWAGAGGEGAAPSFLTTTVVFSLMSDAEWAARITVPVCLTSSPDPEERSTTRTPPPPLLHLHSCCFIPLSSFPCSLLLFITLFRYLNYITRHQAQQEVSCSFFAWRV